MERNLLIIMHQSASSYKENMRHPVNAGLTVKAAQTFALAAHELMTNAAKYGALSVPVGRVVVHWQVERDASGAPLCRICWRESGGPPVVPPSRRGFGQVVIERAVARSVGGTVTLLYNPTGVEWTLVFPLGE